MEKIKYIRGNYNKKEEIKKAFLSLGVINANNYNFDRELTFYYIDDNRIRIIEVNNSLSQLLIEHGEEIKIPDKKELPKTWEEWVKTNPYIKDEFYISTVSTIDVQEYYSDRNKLSYNNLSSKEDAEGLLALIKLKRLRDCYNNGWEPDWSNANQVKYCISFYSNNVLNDTLLNHHCFLAFPTEKLGDEFLNNFRDLIETAKMWL